MDYQTYPPDKELTPFVACYWRLEGIYEVSPQRQTIVPDGCMEMIFHYGDLYRQYLEDGSAIIQPRCFVIGQLTRPLEIEPTGRTDIFSVRFQHDGFLPFADTNIRTMENTAIALNHIFGEDGESLEQLMLQAITITDRINLVEKFLKSRLTDPNAVNRLVRSAVGVLLAVNGHQHIGDYANQSGVDRRHLERQFARVIGLSPKQLGRTIRLHRALKTILESKYRSLTELAYENGYYDQAHFIKEFKEFTGMTPKDFYGEHLEFSSLFYGTD